MIVSLLETLTKCLSMLNNTTATMLHLKQLQAQMIKLSLDRNPFYLSKIIAFSAISGDLTHSCSILGHIDNPTNFMYNAIIRGFSQSKQPHKTFTWYTKMTSLGLSPDKYAYPFVLKACSRLFDLNKGKQVHCQVIKSGFLMNSHIESSLIYLYASCGELGFAKIVIEGVHERRVVSWNAMISGCVRSGKLVKEAFDIFHQMRLDCLESFDKFSLVSVTSACANMGALCLGKWVHGLVFRSGFCAVVPLCNALVDMYGKSGSLDDSCKLFDEMGVRDLVSWSTIIDVLAVHGCGGRAIHVFEKMEMVSGVVPDDMTFTNVLCACSHGGLLREGEVLFDKMIHGYKILPKIQHYGCMVDLLGKAGRLKEAYELIKEMCIEPDAAMWRSLLSACMYHRDFCLAEIVADRLKSLLDPDDLGDSAILSSVFASLGRWDDVEKLRRGARKIPGRSFIEVDNVVHEFVSKDISHPQIDEINLLMNQMVGTVTLLGFS